MKIKTIMVVIISMLFLGCVAENVKNSSAVAGSITILPEQETYAEVTISGGSIIEVKQVDDGGNVSFKLTDMTSGMMMSGKNSLDYTIKYDIYMIDYKGKKHYTSSCPLMAGAGVFESWSHKIPRITLENFRVVPNGGNMACQ